MARPYQLTGIREAVSELRAFRRVFEDDPSIEHRAQIRFSEIAVIQMAESLVDRTNEVGRLISCGHCASCKWRSEYGWCLNDNKLYEDYGPEKRDKNEHLIYPYYEGGGFWVGENFGCVHFEYADDLVTDES